MAEFLEKKMQVVEPGEAIEFEMTYKGFRTIVKYSKEDKVYYGKIEDIFDLVNYESENYEGLERAFHEAVDDYLFFVKKLKGDKMQKYKSYRAMTHKLRLRGIYYYGFRHGGIKQRFGHAVRDYYRFEKEQCKDLGRTCQSAFFTYNCPEPIWRDGLTYYEGDFGKPKGK